MVGLERNATPFAILRQGRGFSPTSIENRPPSSTSSADSMNSWNNELLLPRSRSPLNYNSREFCSAFLSRSGFSGSMPISNPSMDDQIATDLRNIHIVRRRKIQILTNKSEY